MSGLLRPVGPETAQTYWVRRALVFGATMVLAVAVALIISGTSSGSAERIRRPNRRVSGAELSHHQARSRQPCHAGGGRVLRFSNVDASAGGHHTEGATKKSDRGGSLDCSAEELRPTLTGKQRLALKKPNTFQLSLINGSDQTCMARVTRKNFELTIHSGNDRIWSTADCPSVIKPISRKLGAEHAVAWSLTWDGKRSKPDCKSARKVTRPGTYVATANWRVRSRCNSG